MDNHGIMKISIAKSGFRCLPKEKVDAGEVMSKQFYAELKQAKPLSFPKDRGDGYLFLDAALRHFSRLDIMSSLMRGPRLRFVQSGLNAICSQAVLTSSLLLSMFFTHLYRLAI